MSRSLKRSLHFPSLAVQTYLEIKLVLPVVWRGVDIYTSDLTQVTLGEAERRSQDTHWFSSFLPSPSLSPCCECHQMPGAVAYTHG